MHVIMAFLVLLEQQRERPEKFRPEREFETLTSTMSVYKPVDAIIAFLALLKQQQKFWPEQGFKPVQVELCMGIADIRVQFPIQARIFQAIVAAA